MSTTIELNITKIEDKLSSLTSELDSLKGQQSLLIEQEKESEEKLIEFRDKKELYKKSVEFWDLVAKETKEKTKKGFESIVTYALRYILNEDYGFKLEFGRRGNLQEMDLNVTSPGCKQPFNPLDRDSGGVLDVASLALRIAILEVSRPKIPGFLCLDESFKHLDKNKLDYARKFIMAIHKKIGRQIIMVTHNIEFLEGADNIIKL